MSEPVSEPVTRKPQERNPEWWPVAQALRIQGVEIKDIAAQLKVSYVALRKRFERAGMSHVDKHIKQTVLARTVTVTRQANEAAQAVAKNSLRPLLHSIAHDIVDSKAIQRKARTLGQSEQKARVLHTVTQAAKVLEGWSDVTTSVIRQELMSTLHADSLADLPALDVPAEPVPTDVPAIPTDTVDIPTDKS